MVAQAVIITARATPGLKWELSEAFRRLKPNQLILFLTFPLGLFESREDKYQRFVAWTQQLTVKPPSRQVDSAFLMHFDDEWDPHLVGPHANGSYFEEYRETEREEALILREAFHGHPVTHSYPKPLRPQRSCRRISGNYCHSG